MGFFLVLKAEMVRNMIAMRRYWFATLIGMGVGFAMLMGLIMAFMDKDAALRTIPMGDSVTRAALGLIIGMFAFGILGMFSQGLQSMASAGQLEQVCMSPHGLITNFLARSLVGAVSSIMSCTVMLSLVAFTTGGKLHAGSWADWGPLLLLLALTYGNLIGFGFMVGGLVLVFKQVGQIVTLFRLALLFLAMGIDKAQYDAWSPIVQALTHLLPITDAAICLKLVLVDGVGWNVLQGQHFLFLIISGVAWTFVGMVCFRYMENWSRDKGTLGAY